MYISQDPLPNKGTMQALTESQEAVIAKAQEYKQRALRDQKQGQNNQTCGVQENRPSPPRPRHDVLAEQHSSKSITFATQAHAIHTMQEEIRSLSETCHILYVEANQVRKCNTDITAQNTASAATRELLILFEGSTSACRLLMRQ